MFFKKEKSRQHINNKAETPDVAPANEIRHTEKKKRNRIVFDLGFRTISVMFASVLVLILVFWSLNHTDTLSGFLSAAFSVLSPIITGACLAFIINVPLRAIEGIWNRIFSKAGKTNTGIRRPICLTLSIILVIGLVFAIVFMVIPGFSSSFKTIVNSIPKYVETAEGWWDKLVVFAKDFGAVLPEFSIDTQKIIDYVGGFAGNLFGSVFGAGGAIVSQTVSFTASVFSWVANFLIAFVFAIYILAQKEKLALNIKSTLFAFLPEKKVVRILDIARLTNKTFFSFATGQLTEAIIIGVLCYVGMKIFALPHAAVVSVIIGVTALIPVFGAYIGTIVGALLILFVSPIKALWFVVFILVLQQLETNLIYPRVVGDSVGLPGIWVIVCVVVGGDLFGVAGMLLSVPVCAVLYALLKETVYKRLAEKKNGRVSQNAKND